MNKPRLKRTALIKDPDFGMKVYEQWECNDGRWQGYGYTPEKAYEDWEFWTNVVARNFPLKDQAKKTDKSWIKRLTDTILPRKPSATAGVTLTTNNHKES